MSRSCVKRAVVRSMAVLLAIMTPELELGELVLVRPGCNL